MGERGGAYGVLEGEPEGKRPLERTMRPRDESIKTDRQEISWGGEAWNGLIWLRIGTSDGRVYAQ
jgi:hypothetical protein